jgi:hypothetical protein
MLMTFSQDADMRHAVYIDGIFSKSVDNIGQAAYNKSGFILVFKTKVDSIILLRFWDTSFLNQKIESVLFSRIAKKGIFPWTTKPNR